ncbi:MAG: hypothetical protein ABEL76_15015, partial [Bradymonadaceae bacterium]
DALEERFIERSLDEPRTLDKLFRESPMNEERILALLMALDRVGALNREQLGGDTLTRERNREQLDLLYRQSQSENLFERLNVHWTTYEREVERKVEEIHDQLDTIEERIDLDSETREKLQATREAVDRAGRELSERATRREYRREVVDRAEQRSSLQMFEEQLETLTLQRKPEEIADRCKRILEIHPNHEEAERILRKVRTGGSTEE